MCEETLACLETLCKYCSEDTQDQKIHPVRLLINSMFKLEHAENILQDRKTHVKFSLEDTKTQF